MDDPEGHPRVGKPRRGHWPQTIFLSLFAGFGALITLAVAIDWLQGVATYFWEESTCTVESSSVDERPAEDSFELRVTYRYHFRGESFTGDLYRHGYSGSSSLPDAHRLAARYAAGETVPCWIDPDRPWNAYLKRANLWRGLWIFVPLLFVALPLGVLYWVRYTRDLPSGPSRRDGVTKPIQAAANQVKMVGAMVILFGAFFLFGFGMFIPFFVWPVLQVVEARSWQPVECEILSSEVRSHSGDDSVTYSVEARYRYRVDGREYVSNRYRFMSGSSSGYEGKAEAVGKIPAGAVTECFVDPEDPFEAVLDRGLAADFLFGLIPLLFGLIGAVGLGFAWYVARSAKRDAGKPSWARPRAAMEAVSGFATGPIVLEPRFGPIAKLGLALGVALFWNGIVSVFVVQLVKSWRMGSTDWLLALFLTPFVLIGLLLLSGVPYTLLALVNPRPRVQLSPGVLRVGDTAQLDWSFQGASSRVRAVEIWLEATVKETSSQGANVSTTSRELRRIEVLERGEGLPVEFGSVSIRLPSDVEPTSDAVSWKLKLQGRIDYWPDVGEEYEVRVLSDS